MPKNPIIHQAKPKGYLCPICKSDKMRKHSFHPVLCCEAWTCEDCGKTYRASTLDSLEHLYAKYGDSLNQSIIQWFT